MKSIRSIIILLCLILATFANGADMNKTLESKFRNAARNGILQKNLEKVSTFNIEASTMGGNVWWRTIEENGWKLQINTISGWWRILDANNRRVARGTTRKQLESLLEGRPTSVFMNYFDSGCRFSKTAAKSPKGHAVILIHGWGVRSSSMQKLAEALAENGYDAFNYDYPSSEKGIAGHVDDFLAAYKSLADSLPKDEKIHFLTHSMGGIILRGALAGMDEKECRRISSIVMLGPPNLGSNLAFFGRIPFADKINASLGDMTPEDTSFTMTIPQPAWLPPTGIIAGSHDGKVAVEKTFLPKPLPFRHLVVDSTHPSLRNPDKVLSYILHFYDCLEF